jgi:DNA repair photolyase
MPELPPVWVGPMRLKSPVARSMATARQMELAELAGRGPPRGLPVLDTRGRGTEFRELPVRSALNSAAATHMGFWSINPYIGCEFGCSYCYARDTHRYTVERHAASGDLTEETDAALLSKPAVDAFERHILVKRDLADVLIRTLEPARVGNAAIVIGTATDPYQPAERRFRVTRSVLEALLRFNQLHLGIITKSPLITRDIPLLQEIAAKHRLKVHISLATCDGALLRRLEPRTPMPHARLRALAQLSGAGIDSGIMMAPIIPLLTDTRAGLTQLFTAARDAGARRVHGGVLRLGPTARKKFLAQIATEFPELLSRYERHFARSTNAEPAYQKALMERLTKFQVEFGFPAGGRARDIDAINGMDSEAEEQMALMI